MKHGAANMFSWRKITIAFLFLCLLLSAYRIGPFPYSESRIAQGGFTEYWELTLKPFFSAAFQPAFFDQNPNLPADATPFWLRLLDQLAATFRYALVAMSLAVPTGLLLGFIASTAWWPKGAGGKWVKALMLPLNILVRLLMTLMRSIHELIWAIIFLLALGDEPLTACVALALPFAGTLGKVFSEILDEQQQHARNQLASSGAGSVQAFICSLLPQSLPDIITYSLYRFECALRSSAVLGFIGIETIGKLMKDSFDNLYYREVWTELYLLIAVIILVDVIGGKVRHRLRSIPPRLRSLPELESMSKRRQIRTLKRHAPRWKLPRVVAVTLATLVLISWLPHLLMLDAKPLIGNNANSFTEQRMGLALEMFTPKPVRESGSWDGASAWTDTLWQTRGKEALLNSISIATIAIILAVLFATFLLPFATRSLAKLRALSLPMGHDARAKNFGWKTIGFTTRSGFILTRAVPEYIIAYILIGLIGISAWPLIAALVIHNIGILGRLWGEVSENHTEHNPRQLMASGAGRIQVFAASYLPESFNRFLMYFFYRWETCVRDTTVLGMLGFASLGFEIKQSRGFFNAYDQMLYFVLLGAAVIFIADFLSVAFRAVLRKA